MAFFDNLTASLKQKWLQYFQFNRSWIVRQMEAESVDTPDGGKRPSSYLILGVVSALEPQLAELMLPFSKLNPDINALIDALELNFDPELFQDSNFSPTGNPDEAIEALLEITDEVVILEDDEEPFMVMNVLETDLLEDMSVDEIVDEMAQQGSNQESVEPPSATQPEFGDALTDEWNQDTNSEPEQTNSTPPQDEISRLFPNF
ncbi:DUF5331 domain-containing protein [Chroococcidiopsis sp. CCMEE 29]|uniref:DUF5331 domain-containing protein n=1 Tax=Chroococcidiopsis sp. CCMEE 29 TaxID=155894 RepID=UPI0020227179|nr:DUF5331 domain-containing protein [Chroococcidiopsis sp. CCMEE 29]